MLRCIDGSNAKASPIADLMPKEGIEEKSEGLNAQLIEDLFRDGEHEQAEHYKRRAGGRQTSAQPGSSTLDGHPQNVRTFEYHSLHGS